MSRQTTYYYNDAKSDDYLTQKEEIVEKKLKEENIEPTGFPGHDEAFFRVNGEKYSLLACWIPIGDGLREYPTIAQKANMNFHPCVFHKIMSQRIPTWKKQRRIERKIQSYKRKIEKNNEKIDEYYKKYKGQGKIRKTDTKRRKHKDKTTKREKENKKLETKIKLLKKEYDEYEDYSKRISEIFEQDTIKDAKRRFNILNNQIKFLPEEIAKFLRNLEKDLDATLSYIKNENIPKTNNWLELFLNIVFPKKYRNRFKTIKGVDRFLRSRQLKWHENIVLKEKIKIKKENIWTKLRQYTREINEKMEA